MLSLLNINGQTEVQSELTGHRIAKDTKARNQIINSIKSCLNPFDENINKDYLYNISTGKAANNQVADFLLNSNNVGETLKQNFINECSLDDTRFNKPIKRNIIKNFASDCIKKTQKSTDGKLAVVKMERNTFGRY